jgi:hypothetical protein
MHTWHFRIDRNFCSVHEEITSLSLYTPGNLRSWLRKGVYNLIEVISNETYLFLDTAVRLQWPVTHFNTFYQFFLNNVV